MAPINVNVSPRELVCLAITRPHMGLKHAGCTGPTKAEMFLGARTIRNIEMQAKQELSGPSTEKSH